VPSSEPSPVRGAAVVNDVSSTTNAAVDLEPAEDATPAAGSGAGDGPGNGAAQGAGNGHVNASANAKGQSHGHAHK
jgi:hypothetical protein